jgi:hypothetical protein
LFALFGGGTLFCLFFFACLAIPLFALFTFLLCRAFCRQLDLALLLHLALPFFLFFALSLQTLFLFSALALPFGFALFLLCCPAASLFLLPRSIIFGLLSGRFSPRLLFLTLLLLGCFQLGLLLFERRFLGGFFSRPLSTSLLFCLFLLPPFILLFLVLLGFTRLAILGRSVLGLEFAEQLHLAFLSDLFTVRLEDPLFEHACGKNGEHSFPLLHFLILGERLFLVILIIVLLIVVVVLIVLITFIVIVRIAVLLEILGRLLLTLHASLG